MEELKAKGEQVNILPREWYAVELQELKYGHLAKSDVEFAKQKKNPNRVLVNMSRRYSTRQTSYFIKVGQEIRSYSEESSQRLEAAISSDPLLARYGKDLKTREAEKILNQDSAAREAYTKVISKVKKPGTYTEKRLSEKRKGRYL